MGSYVIRLKVLPQDVSTDLKGLAESVSSALPPVASIRAQKTEPIAFGLSALILDIVAPEEEGMVDKIEQAVGGVPTVGQCDMMGVSRMSSRLPPA